MHTMGMRDMMLPMATSTITGTKSNHPNPALPGAKCFRESYPGRYALARCTGFPQWLTSESELRSTRPGEFEVSRLFS